MGTSLSMQRKRIIGAPKASTPVAPLTTIASLRVRAPYSDSSESRRAPHITDNSFANFVKKGVLCIAFLNNFYYF